MTDVDLGGQAARGASVTLAAQLVRLLVLMVSTIVLSRLIAPGDFGLMAIMTSLTALGELVRDFGLSMAVARSVHLTRGQKSNLFWINTVLGAVLGAVTFLLAPAIAAIFSQTELVPIVQSTSAVFLFSGLATQFRAEINRELRFKALAIVDTAPIVVGLVVAVAVALVVPTFWALVAQQISTAVFGLIFAIAFARWWPGLPSRRSSVRELLSFGIGLFGTQAVAYLTRNIGTLGIGWWWGPVPLGIYNRASQLLMTPINQLSAPLTRVAVPILTRVVDDKDRFLRYLEMGQLVGGVGLGVLYGCAIGLADPLVRILFGDGWLSMIPVFQLLAVGGVFRALNQITFWAFLATGKSVEQFRFYLVSQPLIIVSILAGLPWGIEGVAIGHSVGYAVNWVISMWWCGRVIGMSLLPLMRRSIVNIAVFVVPLVVIGLTARQLIGPWPLVLVAGCLGIAIYLSVLLLVSRYARGVARLVWSGVRMLRTRR